jgi:hypothetical protein
VSVTARIGSRHRSATLPIVDLVVCYGGAKLTDQHLASKVHYVDDEIIGWLKRREQRAPRWRNTVESVIYEIVCGQSSYVCELVHYAR